MAFILSLQTRIVSPMRAMDEFDIHMDPKNREAMFKMILSHIRGRQGSQYLVITPLSHGLRQDRARHHRAGGPRGDGSTRIEGELALGDKKLEELLRVISLCQSIESSSANPFDVNIMEKLFVLKKHLPDWEFLDELLLDSEAIYELAQIVKLQDQWLKGKATSLYIDPLLVQLKVKLLSKDALAESFVKSWHPIAQLDQLSPRGLEKAFVYWRDLRPFSERFKDQFGGYGARPGVVDYQELVDLGSSPRSSSTRR